MNQRAEGNKANAAAGVWGDWLWLGLILAAGLAVTLVLIRSPWFAAAQYEEANPGLIALEALKGNFYPIYWGDHYGGTLHAFGTALFFKLFGPSMLVFRLSNYFWWMLFLVFLYLLGRETLGRREGLLAAVLMAVPPAAAAYFSVMGWTGYVANLPVGTALLWLVALGSLREPAPRCSGLVMLLAGVMAGLLAWIHLVGMPYIAAGLAAALWARPRRFIKRDLWLILAGGLIGAAPLIHFNLMHGFGLTGVGTTGHGGLGQALGVLLGAVLPQLLGAVPVYLQNVPTQEAAWWLAVLLSIGLAAYMLRRWLGAAFTAAPMAGKPGAGRFMLLVFIAAAVGAWLLSPRAGDIRPRYLHVLSTALPLIIASALIWLGRFGRALPALGIAGVLVLHLLGLYGFAADKRTPADAGRQEEAVIQFLAKKGYKHFYAHLRIALPLTFMSWGRLIGADYFGCQSAAYLPRVDGAAKVAIVTHDSLRIPHPDEMRRWLKRTLNAKFKQATIGGYTIFHGIIGPPGGGRLLGRRGWSASSTLAGGQAGLCLDGDIATRWHTARPQAQGDALVLDMGRAQSVSGLWLMPGRWVWDGPVNLIIEGSRDGAAWQELARPACLGARWLGPHPAWREAGPSQFWFPAREVRYLRLRVGAGPRPGYPYHWSLAEVFAFGPGEEKANAPVDAEALLQVLKASPPVKLAVSDFLAARLTALSHRRQKTQLAYAPANSRAGCSWPVWPHTLYRTRELPLDSGAAFALEPVRARALVAQLKSWGHGASSRKVAGLELVRPAAGDDDYLPPEPGWRATGQGKDASQIFQGKGGRWTPGRAQAAGQGLELDLGREYGLSGLRLEHGPHQRDYPRALKIYASRDGQAWHRLDAAFASPRGWWTGRGLLADRSSGLQVRWPLTRARYLRLRLAVGDPVIWWSVTRLRLRGPRP